MTTSLHPRVLKAMADYDTHQADVIAHWMDMLRHLQDDACSGMWHILTNDTPVNVSQESPSHRTQLPPEFTPLLRKFWRHMKAILMGKAIWYKDKAHYCYVTDVKMEEDKPTTATLTAMPVTHTGLDYDDSQVHTVHLNFYLIVMHKKLPCFSRDTWAAQLVDYFTYHHACGKRCMSRRTGLVPLAATPLLQLLAQVHPDRPLPDPARTWQALRPLRSIDVYNEPHKFSACVEAIYTQLRPFYPEWQLRRLPYGMPWITSVNMTHDHNWIEPAPQPGGPDFLAWCVPLLKDSTLLQRHRARTAQYRTDVRMSLALALHPRVGHRSALHQALTQSPYGGALRQILPELCNAIAPVAYDKPKRNKAVKRPRDE